MKTPHLYRVVLPVQDIDQSAAFYSRVLGISGERVSSGRHYFDCGGSILACYSPGEDGDSVSDPWEFHPHQYLYFSVSNLELTAGAVQDAGGTLTSAIETMPWGERLFYAKDPFGSLICFVDEQTLFTGEKTDTNTAVE